MTLSSCYYITPTERLHQQLNREAITYLENVRMEMDEFVESSELKAEINQYLEKGSIPDQFFQKLNIKKFSSFLFYKGDLIYWSDNGFPQDYLRDINRINTIKGLYQKESYNVSYRKKNINEATTIVCLFDIQQLVQSGVHGIQSLKITNLNPSPDPASLAYDDLQFAVEKSNIVQSKIRFYFLAILILWIAGLIATSKYIVNYFQNELWTKGGILWISSLAIFSLIFLYVLFPLWDKVGLASELKWSWGSVVLLIWNTILAVRVTQEKVITPAKNFNKQLYSYFTYSVVFLSFLFTAKFFRYLVFETTVPLDFESFFYFNPSSIVSLTSIILISIAFFLIHFKLLSNISRFNLSIKNRLTQFVLATGTVMPLLILGNLDIAILPFILVCSIYLILFELFVESKEKSITWIVTWLILFSGFSAIILFKYNWQKELVQRIELAAELPYDGTEIESEYNIGIYNKGELISTNTPEQYPIRIPDIFANVNKEEIIHDGRSSLVYGNEDIQVIVSKKLLGMIKPISLFSYIFGLFLILSIIFAVINTLYPFLPFQLNLKIANTKSLRTRIQLSVISVILASFVIIAIITVFYFKNSAEDNQINQMRSKLNAIVQSLDIQAFQKGYSWIYSPELKSELVQMSSINDVKIELYDIQGQLVHNVQNDFKVDETRAQRLPVKTLGELKTGKNLLFDQKDLESDRQLISYASIKNDQQRILGFIAIPDMTLNSYVRKNVNEFIGTLLNVYIFLLLLAGSVAIAVANSITRPLVALGENLKKIKLGQRNTTLDWENQDEVGELINNYNQMINKLEDSAQLLAMTERELAWREMAKQVAHEIKNPLTPMKLSIQHMQHAIRSRPEEVDNVVNRVSNTLIEQIDALAQIANEFSNFANMPKPENEKVVLNEIVASSHDLFRKREVMDINLYVPIDEIYVFADKNHLFRVLNNLIKNAIQAIPNSRRGKINIKLFKENNRAIIEVSDNGTGIPDNMKDKVFYPNFTTKSSGTGLGLAISANIIESFNGNIYFETEMNRGTDFYITLPLMHMKDNFEVKKRVAL